MGIAHRVGSLEVGKDCDLIVTDGDFLHYKTFVQYTVVDGKLVYDKEKELFFAHIRPRPTPAPAEKKIDKGENPAVPAEEKAGEAKSKDGE
jgi:cytosine/adenosine deaminase-related metal-dependent hydrolase